jgi:hypothetical protein
LIFWLVDANQLEAFRKIHFVRMGPCMPAKRVSWCAALEENRKLRKLPRVATACCYSYSALLPLRRIGLLSDFLAATSGSLAHVLSYKIEDLEYLDMARSAWIGSQVGQASSRVISIDRIVL